jgi:hypothetical protein
VRLVLRVGSVGLLRVRRREFKIRRDKKQAGKHERATLLLVLGAVAGRRGSARGDRRSKSCPDTARVKPRDWCPLVAASPSLSAPLWLSIGERERETGSVCRALGPRPWRGPRHLSDSDSPLEHFPFL